MKSSNDHTFLSINTIVSKNITTLFRIFESCKFNITDNGAAIKKYLNYHYSAFLMSDLEIVLKNAHPRSKVTS